MVMVRRIQPVAAPRKRPAAADIDRIVHAPIHNAPVEHPRLTGERLAREVHRLAGEGLTDTGIARRVGLRSLDRVRQLREALDCAGPDYTEAAADESAQPVDDDAG